MHEDFGTLVDFLRGELDEPAMVAVRQRLESDAAFFDAFARLRRTFAILRALPRVGTAATPLPSLPQFAPGAAFVADLKREFEARGWVALLPGLMPSPDFIAALRTEFAVRALFACLPNLQPGAELLRSLRTQFSVRSITACLPLAQVRAQWVRALRQEFVLRATLDCLPQIAVRPEFAAALRVEFTQRALAESIPELSVSDRLRRRLQVAMFEQDRAASVAAPNAAEPAKVAALPAVVAGDPFRRRLFKKILLSSRRQVRGEPMKFDLGEYQVGRLMAGAWKRGKRSVSATFAMHAVALVVMFFVWNNVEFTNPIPAQAVGISSNVTPPLPSGYGGPEYVTQPIRPLPYGLADDSHLPVETEDVGLGGDGMPLPPPPEADSEIAMPERTGLDAQADSRTVLRSDNAAWFRLRSASKREKIAYLGSSELYDALAQSLAYLQRMQKPDGNWGHEGALVVPRDQDLLEVQQLELTSAALLAYLGDGHSSKESLLGYDYNVKRGIDWVLKQQRADGRIGPLGFHIVLGHAMATLALAEDYALTRDQRLRKPLRDACRWLVSVRPADGSGGFPYKVGQGASLMTSVWAHMALATARNIRVPEIDAPQARIDDLLSWFGKETNGFTTLRDTGEVLAQTDLLPTSSAASLTLFAVDAGYEMRRATFLARLAKDMPSLEISDKNDAQDHGDARYLFFGSLAYALERQRTGNVSGWQNEFSRTVLANQIKTGGHSGAFESTSQYAKLYGRVFSTAFAALSIENAYRVQLMK